LFARVCVRVGGVVWVWCATVGGVSLVSLSSFLSLVSLVSLGVPCASKIAIV
jgi:hypothetical protein